MLRAQAAASGIAIDEPAAAAAAAAQWRREVAFVEKKPRAMVPASSIDNVGRLRQLCTVLAPVAGVNVSSSSPAVGKHVADLPVLLDAAAVKSFIVDGYLVMTPDDVPGGRENFAASFYDKAHSIAGPDIVGSEHRSRDETLWEALTPEVNAMLGSSTVRGALTSLLGPDFIGPPGNSLMHVSQPSDQMYATLGQRIFGSLNAPNALLSPLTLSNTDRKPMLP
eukprot:SAG31_NODE_7826_length_1588_cov_1.928811_2_plen_223_part_00